MSLEAAWHHVWGQTRYGVLLEIFNLGVTGGHIV